MKYIYTKEMCSACIELKNKYKAEGTEYEERKAERILQPEDEIDREMFMEIARTGANPTHPILPCEIEAPDCHPDCPLEDYKK